LLPLSELLIALALIFNQTALYGAIAAVALLMIFIAAIAISMGRGQAPDCRCFGQLYSRPVGWTTLARNILFALAAGLLLSSGPIDRSIVPESAMIAGGLLLLTAVGGLAVYLQRRSEKLAYGKAAAPAGLPVGSPAPAFDLPHYDGGRGSLEQILNQGKPVLLIFTSPLCGPCVSLFKEIGEWQRAHSDEINVTVVSRGTIKENFVNTVRNGLQNVLLQTEYEVAELYQSKVTPSALLINSDGRIGSLLAAGADEIRALLGSALVN
jgi:thiol-disulfide isomerase/thioredoxin